LPLEVDLDPASRLAEPAGVVERRRTAHVVAPEVVELFPVRRIRRGLGIYRDQLIQGGDEGLGYEAAPEASEPTGSGGLAGVSMRDSDIRFSGSGRRRHRGPH